MRWSRALPSVKDLGGSEQDPKVVLHGQKVQSHLVLACLAHSPPGPRITAFALFLSFPVSLSVPLSIPRPCSILAP